jgi:hypothetical protein
MSNAPSRTEQVRQDIDNNIVYNIGDDIHFVLNSKEGYAIYCKLVEPKPWQGEYDRTAIFRERWEQLVKVVERFGYIIEGWTKSELTVAEITEEW